MECIQKAECVNRLKIGSFVTLGYGSSQRLKQPTPEWVENFKYLKYRSLNAIWPRRTKHALQVACSGRQILKSLEVGSLSGTTLKISRAREWGPQNGQRRNQAATAIWIKNQNAITVKTLALKLRWPFKSAPSCGRMSQLYTSASTSLWTQAVPEKGLDLGQGKFLMRADYWELSDSNSPRGRVGATQYSNYWNTQCISYNV